MAALTPRIPTSKMLSPSTNHPAPDPRLMPKRKPRKRKAALAPKSFPSSGTRPPQGSKQNSPSTRFAQRQDPPTRSRSWVFCLRGTNSKRPTSKARWSSKAASRVAKAPCISTALSLLPPDLDPRVRVCILRRILMATRQSMKVCLAW